MTSTSQALPAHQVDPRSGAMLFHGRPEDRAVDAVEKLVKAMILMVNILEGHGIEVPNEVQTTLADVIRTARGRH